MPPVLDSSWGPHTGALDTVQQLMQALFFCQLAVQLASLPLCCAAICRTMLWLVEGQLVVGSRLTHSLRLGPACRVRLLIHAISTPSMLCDLHPHCDLECLVDMEASRRVLMPVGQECDRENPLGGYVGTRVLLLFLVRLYNAAAHVQHVTAVTVWQHQPWYRGVFVLPLVANSCIHCHAQTYQACRSLAKLARHSAQQCTQH